MKKLRSIQSNITLTILLAALITISCGNRRDPRPKGYFRIDMPPKEYITYDSICPFTFKYPAYSSITPSDEFNAEPCWLNIEFPAYKAKIHLSYKSIDGNLKELFEDSYSLTYNHSVKADAIWETPYHDYDERVFGLLYDLKGNTATSVQFHITDSTHHFLRGALYFSALPNEDSLAPVVSRIRDDIMYLMETIRWK